MIKARGLGRGLEALGVAEQPVRQGEPEGNRLAGAGLRRDQHVAAGGRGLQHGQLHGRRLGIGARDKGPLEGVVQGREGHGRSILVGGGTLVLTGIELIDASVREAQWGQSVTRL